MDVSSHDIDQVKQRLMYKLKHQQRGFERMELIYRENVAKPIFVKLLLETRINSRAEKINVIYLLEMVQRNRRQDNQQVLNYI